MRCWWLLGAHVPRTMRHAHPATTSSSYSTRSIIGTGKIYVASYPNVHQCVLIDLGNITERLNHFSVTVSTRLHFRITLWCTTGFFLAERYSECVPRKHLISAHWIHLASYPWHPRRKEKKALGKGKSLSSLAVASGFKGVQIFPPYTLGRIFL